MVDVLENGTIYNLGDEFYTLAAQYQQLSSSPRNTTSRISHLCDLFDSRDRMMDVLESSTIHDLGEELYDVAAQGQHLSSSPHNLASRIVHLHRLSKSRNSSTELPLLTLRMQRMVDVFEKGVKDKHVPSSLQLQHHISFNHLSRLFKLRKSSAELSLYTSRMQRMMDVLENGTHYRLGGNLYNRH